MKCQYTGCKNQATMKLTMGGKSTIHCCDKCAPSWAKGDMSYIQSLDPVVREMFSGKVERLQEV